MQRDKSKKKKKLVEVEMEEERVEVGEHVIKPTENGEKINSSDWPLLLKNYHKMNVLSSHYTPIPAGSTPYKRPLK